MAMFVENVGNVKPGVKGTSTQVSGYVPDRNPVNVVRPTTTNVSYTAPTNEYSSYNSILEAYKNQLAQQRDSHLAEIEARLNANRKAYEDQFGVIEQEYGNQRNASEVNRYKSKKALREALANRGQLDSGIGRQQALENNVVYDNALNNINLNEANAKNTIRQYIAQLEADAQREKANANQSYSNTLLSLLNA